MGGKYSFTLSSAFLIMWSPSGIVVLFFPLTTCFFLENIRVPFLLSYPLIQTNKLVPLAFALVEKENKDSWGGSCDWSGYMWLALDKRLV
jgi:hypothetical protein